MLVIKIELAPGEFIETSIDTDKIGNWINSHSIEDRLSIFNSISLETKTKKESKKVLTNISEQLLKADFEEKELFTLLSTFDYYAKKFREKINKLES